VKAQHQHRRDADDPQLRAWQHQIADLERQPEMTGNGTARRPDQKGNVLQYHRDAKAGDDDPHPGKRNATSLTGQPPGLRALLRLRPEFFLGDRRELGDG